MDRVTAIVSQNLRRIRRERGLSLDQVSSLTGVSKSMLGQIERGESNPTISTVWKIANGFKVSFTAILEEKPLAARVVSTKNMESMEADEGRYRLYPLFPFEEGRLFEIYQVEIEPGGKLEAEPHRLGTEEFVTVFRGVIVIESEGREHVVKEGEAIRFKADGPHGYRNPGEEPVQVSMVIHYKA